MKIKDEILKLEEEAVSDSDAIGNSANVRRATREEKRSNLQVELDLIPMSWKYKLIWSIIVPLFVSIVTAYVVAKYFA